MRPDDRHASDFGQLSCRQVAPWRSIRMPRLLSKIGPPARTPIAWSIARPTAGGSGISTILVPLPHTQDPAAVPFAEVGDVGPGCFEDAKAEEPEHGDQHEVARAR